MIKAPFIIVLLFVITSVFSQNTKIIIKSKSDSTVIPYANICIEQGEKKSYCTTNTSGEIEIPFKNKLIISISSVGYKTLIDTLVLNSAIKTFYLDEKFYETDEVVITGQYKAVTKDKSIYSIKVIDSKKIENLASNNLSELLENQLNIKINNDPSTGSGLELNGISGENIKILIDGVPIIGRLDGNIDLSQINLEEVDHIEIVEGPMSVSYGSNALGGVINIVTKENKYASIIANIRTYYETVGQYNISGSFSKKFKKSSIKINGSRKFFSGFSLNDSLRSQTWKPKEQYNFGAYYLFQNNKTKLKIKSDYFNERLLSRGNLLPPYYEKAYDKWFYTQRINNSLNYSYIIDSANSFNLLNSYSYYHRMSNRFIKDLTTLNTQLTENREDHDTIAFKTFISRGIYNRAHKDFKFNYQLGYDFNYEIGQGKRMQNNGDEIYDLAAFSSIQWKISKKLWFQPAVRFAYNSKYKAPVSPSLNFKYSHGNSIFRFSYAKGFRAPSLKELNLLFYDSNHQIEGNSELKAEKSHNFNGFYTLNSKLFKRKMKLNLKAYFNTIQDMIALVQVDPDNLLRYKNENIGEFKNIGSELSINYLLLNSLRLNFGYGYGGRKDAAFISEDYIFSSTINSGISYRFLNNRANIIADYKYFGKNPVYTYLNNELTTKYSENYHNLDVIANINFFKNTLKVSAGVKNIFDNTTILQYSSGGSHSGGGSSLVGWGRTFQFSLAYKFYKY